jgi:hypothetical protein
MSRHSLPLAAVTVALALAACSDAPLDPAARLAPDATPSADIIVVGGGIPRPTPVTVTLRITDQGGNLPDQGVAGTTVKFTTSTGAQLTVVDNAAGDGDARVGFYKVTMGQAVSYTATVVAMPSDFSPDQTTKTVSAFVTPTLVSMGELMLLRKPGIAVALYYNGALTIGQTIKVTGPNGYSKTMTDGTATDIKSNGTQGPADGKFDFQVPSTGTYTVCTMTTPQSLWDAGCSPVYVINYFIQYPITMTYTQKWFIPKL